MSMKSQPLVVVLIKKKPSDFTEGFLGNKHGWFVQW
jgi:hypothetical protein